MLDKHSINSIICLFAFRDSYTCLELIIVAQTEFDLMAFLRPQLLQYLDIANMIQHLWLRIKNKIIEKECRIVVEGYWRRVDD